MQKSLGAVTTSLTGALEARKAQSGTGTQLGASGAAVSLTSGVMVENDPLATDRNLRASLPPHIASLIASDGRVDALETRWLISGGPDRQTLEAAYSASMAAMQPATESQLTKALAALRAVTKARETADADLDLATAVMVRELQMFPADLALNAIREAAQRSTFFPALAELIEACGPRTARRQHLHRLLARTLG